MRSCIRQTALVLLLAIMHFMAAFCPVCVSAQAPATVVPPAFPKKFYRSPTGQLYVPAGVPVQLGIALSTATQSATTSEGSSVVLKEGPSALELGDAKVPVIADGTPPTTTLNLGDTPHIDDKGIHVLGAHPKLKLTATDALSGVAQVLVSIDGAPFVPLPAGGPVFTTEGNHKLLYFSVDHVGNVEKVQQYIFNLDGTPPQTQLQASGPHADSVFGAASKISLSATDAVSGLQSIQYRLDDGTELPYDRPFLLDLLTEGRHRLTYYALDNVDNKEQTHTFSFSVDRQPPDISVTLSGPLYSGQGVRYITPQSVIAIKGHDAVAGNVPLQYRLDGASVDTTYTSPLNMPPATGIHHLRITAEDNVKNQNQVNVDDLYVDITPPTTEVVFSRPFFVRDGQVVLAPSSQIALNTSDFESGVKSVTYTLDSGPVQNYTAPFSVNALGPHRLSVTAVDHVGNTAPVQQFHLLIQQPASGVLPPPTLDAKRWYVHPKFGLMGPPGLPFELRISSSPDDGAESFVISSGPSQSDAAAPLAFTNPGQQKLKVAITKKAETFSVPIDAAAPKTQLTASGAHRVDTAGTTYFGPGLNISLTSTDDPNGIVSGLWKTLYSLDGLTYATYSGPLNVFSRDGAYALRYYALDNVGNAENTHTFNFTVDATPPKTRLDVLGPHSGATIAPNTRAQLTASDNLSGVAHLQYQLDDGKISDYASPIAIGALGGGTHRLRYFAVDAAGNQEELHTWPFTIESVVGDASFEVRGNSVAHGGTVFVSPGCIVILKAPEGDTVVYSLDGATFKPYTAPIPAPSSGTLHLSFHAVDDLGTASTTHTVNISADNSAPGSHIRFDGPQIVRDTVVMIGGNTRIVLDASAGAVGGAALEYSLNGVRWQPYTGPFTLKVNGAVTLSYRARNALSVTGPAQRQRVMVYSRGPSINVTYSAPVQASGDSVTVQPGTLLLIDTSDVPAGLQKITYKVDDRPEFEYRAPLSGFSPEKLHTIRISAEDLLGNRSEKVVHLLVKGQTK